MKPLSCYKFDDINIIDVILQRSLNIECHFLNLMTSVEGMLHFDEAFNTKYYIMRLMMLTPPILHLGEAPTLNVAK